MAIKAKSISDVLATENIAENTIGYLARYAGEDKLRSVLVLSMLDMLRFFNLTQGTMSEQQLVQTIVMIQEDYGYLTLADFKVFFTRIKKGYYGQIYNRIDGQMILRWLADYAEERSIAASEDSIREAYSQRGRDNDTPARVKKLVDSLMLK